MSSRRTNRIRIAQITGLTPSRLHRTKAILARRLEKVEGEFLFPGRETDQPVIKVNRAHVGTLARVNLLRSEANQTPIPHFRLYDLRHTWATRGAMAAIDLNGFSRS